MVARSSSLGIKPDQLTPELLKKFELAAVDQINANSHGASVAAVHSSYVDQNGRRIAMMKITGTDGRNDALFFAIVGSDMIRVACMEKNPAPLPLSSGPCHDAVFNELGVQLSN